MIEVLVMLALSLIVFFLGLSSVVGIILLIVWIIGYLKGK